MSDNPNVVVNDRRIILMDQISRDTALIICDSLIDIIKRDDEDDLRCKDFVRRPIELHICSHGGNVVDANAIIGVIQSSKTPIHTYGMGIIASSALSIFISAHRRFSYSNTMYLFHEMSICINGYNTLTTDKDTIASYSGMQDYSESLLLSKTKITRRQINNVKKNKKDWYITTEEAKELGIFDEYV